MPVNNVAKVTRSAQWSSYIPHALFAEMLNVEYVLNMLTPLGLSTMK